MKEKILDLARSQLGYAEESGNRTKYAKYFDTEAWQWFNTKKQGTEWCAIFICWLFCQVMGPQAALVFLGCSSPKNNCAAGVKYLWGYMKAKGYKVDKKTGQPGDVIFLNSNKHVGIIEEVRDGKYITIEGNKGNKVARGSYGISSSTVYGICRPAYPASVSAPAPSNPSPAPSNNSGYSDQEIKVAKDVIKGKYGNGQTRRHNLAAAGYDFSRIQGLVNKIIRGEVK